MTKPLREVTPLGEAKVSPSGRMRVHAITAGKGSSGYYSPEVLREAASNKLIAAGTPLFFDHPSETDRTDRPERSVRDISAVFINEARYDEHEQALVGDIQVFGPYRELLTEMAPHIGLSIHGSATDIDRNGAIEGLAAIDSVDWVTRAGRGGKVVALLESAVATAREAAARDINVPATRPDSNTQHTTESEEDTMPEIKIGEAEHQRLVGLAGRVEALEAERDTEKARADAAEQKLAEVTKPEGGTDDAPVVSGPRKVVAEHIQNQDDRIARLEAREGARSVIAEVLAEAWIGEAQKQRLTTELMADLPMTEGKLDESALRNKATDRVNEAETEAAEILESAGVGSPRGLGALSTPATEIAGQKFEDELVESFQRRGLSESAANLAAKGH